MIKSKKKFGEFKCPHCNEVFFELKKLHGHIGGAHKKNITKDGKPICKFCKNPLIEGKNWAKWAIKQRNLICISCKRKQNRTSYRHRIEIKIEKRKQKLQKFKETKLNVLSI